MHRVLHQQVGSIPKGESHVWGQLHYKWEGRRREKPWSWSCLGATLSTGSIAVISRGPLEKDACHNADI